MDSPDNLGIKVHCPGKVWSCSVFGHLFCKVIKCICNFMDVETLTEKDDLYA